MLSALLYWALLALSVVTTAILFARLLYYCGYGLNLGDEGFYLNFIANPFPYAMNNSASLFGFVYHWPYQWVGGDIAVLRMANVVLTTALGWILGFLVIRRLWKADWPHAAVLSAGIASLALYHFRLSWGLTPNHYSLASQSLMLVMIGLLLAERQETASQVLGAILVGVSGWCCFMAKPTTAAAIALVVILYVVILRRKSLLHMLGAALVAFTLLVSTAYLLDGGIIGLVSRMVNSVKLEATLGSGHDMSGILRIDALATSRSQVAMAVIMAVGLLLGVLIGDTQKLLISIALIAALIITLAIALLQIDPISVEPSLLFLAPAFACLGAMFYRRGLIVRIQTPSSTALTLTFFVLPLVFALGSRLNYWSVGSMEVLFWMLAVVAFLSPLAQQGCGVATLLPLSVLAQLLVAPVVSDAVIKPFAQVKDLRTYSKVISMPRSGKLVLSKSFHDHLSTARAQARTAGLEAGLPLICLTGRASSLLYVLETRALGLPWLAGGHPGSNAVAVETLGSENCADLAIAWVLIEPEGERHLDQASVMASFGAAQENYVAVATFAPPVFEGEYSNAARQLLLKPLRSAALAEQSCREIRRQRPLSQKANQW
ncbi:hypothetical protein LRP30_31010 [Bradyrhizobium sp. C-145]|uniref:hypothetical protein n=1 Tax=Bradyrhizobium sp. C-145 TaxID=574727 RepID=UPI00201B4F42|nr:hypothetical protein [Bradyrhizobium sp. C-145]UQR61347.1 hypothetical protein LRP30_31010 [Bradyrhizobium sp. C-145]